MFQHEEGSKRNFLGRDKKSPLKELLRDHGQYGLSVTIKESECYLCVCLSSIILKTTKPKFLIVSFDNPSHHVHANIYIYKVL